MFREEGLPHFSCWELEAWVNVREVLPSAERCCRGVVLGADRESTKVGDEKTVLSVGRAQRTSGN